MQNRLNGADGLAIDEHDNLWIAANQFDVIDVVSPSGKLLARLGDFEDVDCDGLPHVLLFAVSPAFSNDRKFLLATDLALDLRILV